jgi:hypothetical protein
MIPNSMVYAAIALVFCAAIGFAYDYYRYEVNGVLFKFAKMQLWAFAMLGFDNAEAAYKTISEANPGEYTFDVVQRIYGYVGNYTRWVFAALIATLALRMYLVGIGSGYARRLTMEKLLEENVVAYPSLAPVVGRKILDEDPNKGSWRVPLQPLQFAVPRKLLINSETGKPVLHEEVMDKDHFPIKFSKYLEPDAPPLKLDKAKAKTVFEKQLGLMFKKPIFNENNELNLESVKDLPDYCQGLVAIFLAYSCGASGREDAEKMIDQMALSFREDGRRITIDRIVYKKTYTQDFDINITGAKEIIEKYSKRRELYHSTKHHVTYINTWMCALYIHARKKGVLPTSLIIWLRPTDRALWYVLNQVGGDTPWVEGAAAWAHMSAEQQYSRTLRTPMIGGAIEGLEEALQELCWLPAPPKTISVDEV